MGGTTAAQNSTAVGTTPGAATAVPEGSGSGKMPLEAMQDLMAEMTKLVETPVTAKNQEERNAALTKLHEEMAEVQKGIDAENRRLAVMQARINDEAERLRNEAWHLNLQKDASYAVHRRRHTHR
jgi:hypothetical protein